LLARGRFALHWLFDIRGQSICIQALLQAVEGIAGGSLDELAGLV